MIDFAIIALPRSGTTWAANWLTGDRSVCLHDPMPEQTPGELVEFGCKPGKARGISCTGMWLVPGWVAENVRDWIIIERPIDEVNQSLVEIGLGPMQSEAVEAFRAMPGDRLPMSALFDAGSARAIWERLLPGIEFDAERHALLKGLTVNPFFQGIEPKPDAVRAWLKKVQEASK